MNGKIEWGLFSIDNLQKAKNQGKIIFICICPPGKVLEMLNTAEDLCNPNIYNTINNKFLPLITDIEDEPYLASLGIDLLLQSNKKAEFPLYLFLTPQLQPIISTTEIRAIDFIANLPLESYKTENRSKKESNISLIDELQTTLIVNHNLPINNTKEKSLHCYVKDWEYKKRYLDSPLKNESYTTKFSALTFLIQYYNKYNKHKELDSLIRRIDSLYNSEIYDPINRGFFSQALLDTPEIPLYEKTLIENCNAAILFSYAYKYTKEKRFKEYTIDIIEYIERELKTKEGGYINLSTINKDIEESRFYKTSIKELKDLFPNKYSTLIMIFNMPSNCSEDKYVNMQNTPLLKLLSNDDIKKLREREANTAYINELEYDKRVIFANNCFVATTFCTIAHNIPSLEDIYITKSKEVIEFISSFNSNNTEELYRYLTPSKELHKSSNLLDYAQYIEALLNLYEATKSEEYLQKAIKQNEYLINNFYSNDSNLFSKCNRELYSIFSYKIEPIADFEYRSENSIIANNLAKLYKITKNTTYSTILIKQIHSIEDKLLKSGPYMSGWAAVYLNLLSK